MLCLTSLRITSESVSCLNCYECKSQAGENNRCEDPSLLSESNQRRCQADEKCIKIVQLSRDSNKKSIIRDCYKTDDMKDGYYAGLDYYGSKLEANLFVCEKNMCNSQAILRSTVSTLIVTWIVMSLLSKLA